MCDKLYSNWRRLKPATPKIKKPEIKNEHNNERDGKPAKPDRPLVQSCPDDSSRSDSFATGPGVTKLLGILVPAGAMVVSRLWETDRPQGGIVTLEQKSRQQKGLERAAIRAFRASKSAKIGRFVETLSYATAAARLAPDQLSHELKSVIVQSLTGLKQLIVVERERLLPSCGSRCGYASNLDEGAKKISQTIEALGEIFEFYGALEPMKKAYEWLVRYENLAPIDSTRWNFYGHLFNASLTQKILFIGSMARLSHPDDFNTVLGKVLEGQPFDSPLYIFASMLLYPKKYPEEATPLAAMEQALSGFSDEGFWKNQGEAAAKMENWRARIDAVNGRIKRAKMARRGKL